MSPSGVGAIDAKELLKAGISRIAEEARTPFTFIARVGEVSFMEIEGIALEGRRWQATVRSSDPTTRVTYVLHARSVDGSEWMQMEGWKPPAAGCWLRLGPRQVPVGIQGLLPGEPGYLTLLGYLANPAVAGVSASSTFLSADLRLSAASFLLQGQVFQHIELTESQANSGSVRVKISIEGDRLTRLELSGAEMLRAIERAGGSVGSTFRAGLELSRFTVGYLPPGGAIRVSAPAKNLVMTDLQRGCH